MQYFNVTYSQLYSLYLLLTIFFSASWVGWRSIGPFFCSSLFLFLLFLNFYTGFSSPVKPDPSLRPTRLHKGNFWKPSLIVAFLITPSLIYLILTWNQEFPFRGDQDYHFFSASAVYNFWRRKFIFYTSTLSILGFFCAKLRKLPFFIFSFFISLLIVGRFTEYSSSMFRYPTLGYLFELPIYFVARLTHWDSFLNVNRLTNFLSIPIWLLFLRPLLIGRWPDLAALGIGTFLFFQKDFVYYFSSGYLEPWSIIWVLLATEFILQKDRIDHIHSCLILGVAAVIKEQAIFVLPFFWIACVFQCKTYKERLNNVLVGIVSVFPFTNYYLLRRALGVTRDAGIAPSELIFSSARFYEFFHRLVFQFGQFGSIAVAGLLTFTIIICLFNFRKNIKLFYIFGASLFQFVFFYIDKVSAVFTFTGYTRFHLIAFALLIGGLVPTLNQPNEWFKKNSVIRLLCCIFLLANLPQLINLLTQATRADYARNFNEHYDAPVYFPIRKLITQAEQTGNFDFKNGLDVGSAIGSEVPSLSALPLFYGTFVAHIPIRVLEPATLLDTCSCLRRESSILVPFVYFTNLRASDPKNSAAESCHLLMEQTCSHLLIERYDGEIVGLLGGGNKFSP